MLGVKTYERDYIDSCRAQMEDMLARYAAVVDAAGDAWSRAALAELEPKLLNQLVVALDACFVHRIRAIEGKDGNPLNEVRMLAASILQHGAVLTLDKTIKYKLERSVLGIAAGEPIALDPARFAKVLDAFIAEIGARFT
jgi:hypothetical protein